jgi:hypothetical protein
MKRRFAVFFLLSVCAGLASALSWELGSILGGGLETGSMAGGYFEAKEASLIALWTTGPGEPGTVRPDVLPSLTAGGYAELILLDWLSFRAEPRASLMGAAAMAYTGTGAAVDRFGAFFYGLLLPLYVRGRLVLGPGTLTVSAGGFGGMVISNAGLGDTYASTSTLYWVEFSHGLPLLYGASGGLGYSLPLGPGIASIELRADWTLSPVRFTVSSAEGELNPLEVSLCVGYGMGIGGAE